MFDALDTTGLPALLVLLLATLAWLAREAWVALKDYRIKAAEEVYKRILGEIDDRLTHFYLPLRERLSLSRDVFAATQNWRRADGSYDNSCAGVVSTSEHALREIATQRILLPLNESIKSILLENQHLREIGDTTNYGRLLVHLVLWNGLESALAEGKISAYDGESFLRFPASVTQDLLDNCERLLKERETVRKRIMQLDLARPTVRKAKDDGKVRS